MANFSSKVIIIEIDEKPFAQNMWSSSWWIFTVRVRYGKMDIWLAVFYQNVFFLLVNNETIKICTNRSNFVNNVFFKPLYIQVSGSNETCTSKINTRFEMKQEQWIYFWG